RLPSARPHQKAQPNQCCPRIKNKIGGSLQPHQMPSEHAFGRRFVGGYRSGTSEKGFQAVFGRVVTVENVIRLPEKFGRFSGSLWYWAQQTQVQIRRCAVIVRMPIQPKQTSVFRKWMFDGAKVVRRVEGNLWVFGMVALEKTCFKGQMPSENRFQTAFSVYLKQTGKGSNILQSSYSHKRFIVN
ncbi:TPA: hypothetical protein ACJKBU_002152, partial [Neisseria meningitidis]